MSSLVNHILQGHDIKAHPHPPPHERREDPATGCGETENDGIYVFDPPTRSGHSWGNALGAGDQWCLGSGDPYTGNGNGSSSYALDPLDETENVTRWSYQLCIL